METHVQLEHISKTYRPKGQSEVIAVRDASLQVTKGEIIAIMGVSGSGKSTLLHMIGLLERAQGGTLFVNREISKSMSNSEMARLRNAHIGFVLQDFALIPYRSASDNIEVPMVYAKKKRKERYSRIKELLLEFEIDELADRKINQMSGGQKQRVAIARALANNPDLILADEPTGALDSKTKKEILDIFRRLNESGKTIIIVTHDPEVAAIADRIVHMTDGYLSEGNSGSSNL